MTEEFNKWWDEDVLVEDNPFTVGTSAYWAWEGWCAAVKAEREACAKVCDEMEEKAEQHGTECCKWPTPSDCAYAIRNKGNT
jgi:hypothetical protein